LRKQHTLTVLVKRMTVIAHSISDLISASFEQDATSITLHAVYRQCSEMSQSAMTVVEFADMASQLLVYSCFVARYYHKEPTTFQRQHITAILSYAHPLHRQCVEAIMSMEPLATCIDEVVSLPGTLDRQSIDRSFQDDPLTHFYERFLHYYNPRLRASHGIYYTPQPVISYITRSINYLLRSRFDCRDGLADSDASISILDPACGTGVFVQAALEHARAAYQRRGQAERWPAHLYQHLLPRLTGIEVLVTPYLIAHLRLNLFLTGMDTQADYSPETTLSACHSSLRSESHTGHERILRYAQNDRRGLRMTGAEDRGFAKNLPMQAEEPPAPFRLGNALSEPDTHQDAPDTIMIVLGNPPYAGHSANKEAWMLSLLDEYKEGCPELKQRAQAKWLSDDYVKFIRLAQWRIDRAGQGILAFITSHSYLDNPTFRGMRHSLTRSFDELFVLDLHGNSKKQELAPGATRDENVFAIQSGTAISIFVKKKDSPTHPPTISHAHVWGSRADKLSWLAGHDLESTA